MQCSDLNLDKFMVCTQIEMASALYVDVKIEELY